MPISSHGCYRRGLSTTTGSSCLNPADDETIYLVRVCVLHRPIIPVPGIGLGGLVPQPDGVIFGGLPLASTDFRDFRAHRPCMKIDDFLLLPGDSPPLFLISSTPAMTASAAHHFGLPLTPLSL